MAPNNPLLNVATYVLEFLLGTEHRTVLVQAFDAANGVILEETAEDSGIMRGRLLSGGKVEIPFPQILKIERYKVDTWNGQTHKVTEVTEAQLLSSLERAPRSPEGEVRLGNVETIQDSKGNKVYESERAHRQKEL